MRNDANAIISLVSIWINRYSFVASKDTLIAEDDVSMARVVFLITRKTEIVANTKIVRAILNPLSVNIERIELESSIRSRSSASRMRKL